MLKCFCNLSNYFKSNHLSIFRFPKSTNPINIKHMTTTTSSAVRVRKALPRDIPRVLKMLREQFAKNESLVDGLQMSKNSFTPALEELWRNHLEEGMTLMAIPRKYEGPLPIFGAVINTKLCSWDPDFFDKFAACVRCPKTRDLIHLWALFIRESKIHEKFGKNPIFNIANVIVNEELSLGNPINLSKVWLAKLLVSMSIQLARSRDFEVVCMTCTNDHMAQVASETGLDVVWEYPFDKLLNVDLNPIVKCKLPDSHVKVFAQKF